MRQAPEAGFEVIATEPIAPLAPAVARLDRLFRAINDEPSDAIDLWLAGVAVGSAIARRNARAPSLATTCGTTDGITEGIFPRNAEFDPRRSTSACGGTEESLWTTTKCSDVGRTRSAVPETTDTISL
jgi:hypothetical protein